MGVWSTIKITIITVAMVIIALFTISLVWVVAWMTQIIVSVAIGFVLGYVTGYLQCHFSRKQRR